METITGNIYYITTKLMNLPKEEKEKIFDLSEHKEKRSLSQNAYAWKLINEIANKVNLSKEEVHMNMLKHYSQVFLSFQLHLLFQIYIYSFHNYSFHVMV